MINNYIYNASNLAITKEVATTYINMFWNDTYQGIINSNKESHIMLILKVQFADESMGYKTIGHLRKVNFIDKDRYIKYIVERLGILNESYSVSTVSNVIFSYIVKEGQATGNRALLSDLSNKELKCHRFNNMTLPVTMNPEEYGKVLGIVTSFEGFSRYFIESKTTSGVRTYQIDVSNDKTHNTVTLLGGSELVWSDTINLINLNSNKIIKKYFNIVLFIIVIVILFNQKHGFIYILLLKRRSC